MGFLSPTGGNNWSSARRDLLLSGTDVSEAKSFGNITNVDYAYLDITLRQGQTSEVKWNFAGTDYAPYNDGSFASLVPILETSGGGTLNGSLDSFSPLASILGPGKRVGDYGKSGWETLEVGSTTGGDYRLGFATFNVNDTAVTPALFIDHIPDNNNNAPFANSLTFEISEDIVATGLTLWGPKLLETVVLIPPFHPPVPFSKLRDSEKLASAIVERGLDVPSFDHHRSSKLIAATGFCIAISKYFLY